MIAVIDSSAYVALFTAEKSHTDPRMYSRIQQVTMPHVPDILDIEFHHAVRGLLLGRKITSGRADFARRSFAESPKKRFPTPALTDRIWALRHNLGAYDACFIALAEALHAPLLTCDDKQATASGHHADVEVFDLDSRHAK